MDSRRVAPGRQTPSCSCPDALVRWHLLRKTRERVHQAARHTMGRRALGGMLAAAVWLLVQPGFPGAQMSQPGEPPAQLEPVVVTATRTATPVQATGASVTVRTADEIRARQVSDLVDVFRDMPGLDVRA